MIDPAFLFNQLQERGICKSFGVPDSLLKSFCAYLQENGDDTITANEGSAIAMASGYYLASGKTAMVYLQNSGLGNTINPLLSLADPEVYSIPMLVLCGWRGFPNTHDEPQHLKQGKTLEPILKALEIGFLCLAEKESDISAQLDNAVLYMKEKSAPFFVLVPPNRFSAYSSKTKAIDSTFEHGLIREKAIACILNELADDTFYVSTTGKSSRELYEIRKSMSQTHSQDFLTVGSMGHASQIALAIALEKPKKKVVCIDGDGAALMHLGGMTSIGELRPKNLIHIVINNGAHESVGGQPTASANGSLKFYRLAENMGYASAMIVTNMKELVQSLKRIQNQDGPHLIEITAQLGSRKDLGRPKSSLIENKAAFMKAISQDEA